MAHLLKQLSRIPISQCLIRAPKMYKNRIITSPVNFCRSCFKGPSSDNYRFAKSHEWIALESDNTATVGISDHAQDALGEAVYVDLPDVGDELQQGDVFGVVESVKAAADLYSPVGGEVTEVNKDLTDSPSIINEDPYNAGWIMKLKIKDNAEFDSLMTAEEYEKFLTEDN